MPRRSRIPGPRSPSLPVSSFGVSSIGEALAQARRRPFELALVLVYAGVAFAMVPLHEPWRDEAQAWLIARDLSPLGVLAQMRAELSTPLWHLLLWPFAQLGLPFWIAQVLNAAFAVGTVAVVSFASPFARWQKLVFAASFLMAYEYGVVARSYGASFFFGVALAAGYPRRHERPGVYTALLLGLAGTNLHSLLLASVLGGIFAWELWRRRGSPFADRRTWLVAGVVAALTLLVTAAGFADRALRLAMNYGLPEHWKVYGTLSRALFATHTPNASLGTLTVVAAILAGWQARRRPTLLVALVVPLLVYALSPLAHRVTIRHSGFVLLTILFVLWTQTRAAGPPPRDPSLAEPFWARFVDASAGPAGVLLFLCLATTIPSSFQWLRSDATSPASASAAMGRHIAGLELDAPIAARRASLASGLLPYLPGRQLWYADAMAWGTFVDWSPRTFGSRLPEDEFLARVRREFRSERPWLISNRPLERPARHGYILAHAETELGRAERGREIYFLYRPRSPLE